MMVPGKEAWFEEGGYLLGFYGENTFIQLAMRMAFMMTMTAIVGGIVAASIKDQKFKREMAVKLGWLGISATLIGAALFQLYLKTVPDYALLVMENRLPEFFGPSILIVLALTLGYFFLTMIRPQTLVPAFAGSMAVILLVLGLWPEETARESMRKPWVAGQYVYSNQVIGRDVPGMGIESQLPHLEEHGLLKSHPMTPEHMRTTNSSNQIQAGEMIAMTYCSNCHSPSETGIRPLHRYIADDITHEAMTTYIKGVLVPGHIAYMPKMPMLDEEAEALAAYLVLNKQGGLEAIEEAIQQEKASQKATAYNQAAQITEVQ